jgi:serine/threonine protein phosphatase 1
MPSRTIAIGDIHGCSAALDALLQWIEPAEDDLIVALGDYIDRGPDSRAVIERMLELQKHCHLVPLLGNHELMLLQALQVPSTVNLWLRCGGSETMASYGRFKDIPEEHLDFIRQCRSYYETPSHLFFHANYEPMLEPQEQPEDVLFWYHLHVSTPPPHRSGKTAILGHTPQPDGEVLDLGHLVCIDTNCYGDGWLTALDVHSRQTWQTDKHGSRRM